MKKRLGLRRLAALRSRGCGGRVRSSRRFQTLASNIPELFLTSEKLAVVRRIEIEQRAARFEMLDKCSANREGGTRCQHGHDKARGDRADEWNGLEQACRTDAAGCGHHCAGECGNQTLADVFGEVHVVDLRNPTDHLQLQAR